MVVGGGGGQLWLVVGGCGWSHNLSMPFSNMFKEFTISANNCKNCISINYN